jgi:hypothetical protein
MKRWERARGKQTLRDIVVLGERTRRDDDVAKGSS